MYCCVINCTNNTKASIDPRTERPVRMHKFPNPIKERERCLRWIANLRRADLNLKNLRYKKVCSIHFEASCYNYENDISSSSLKCSAVPTIVQFANPSESNKRSKKVPAKTVIIEEDEHSDSYIAPSPEKVEKINGLDLVTALQEIEQLKKENYKLSQKLKRLQQKCTRAELIAKRALAT